MRKTLSEWTAAMAVMAVLTGAISQLDTFGSRLAFLVFAGIALLAGIGWFIASLIVSTSTEARRDNDD